MCRTFDHAYQIPRARSSAEAGPHRALQRARPAEWMPDPTGVLRNPSRSRSMRCVICITTRGGHNMTSRRLAAPSRPAEMARLTWIHELRLYPAAQNRAADEWNRAISKAPAIYLPHTFKISKPSWHAGDDCPPLRIRVLRVRHLYTLPISSKRKCPSPAFVQSIFGILRRHRRGHRELVHMRRIATAVVRIPGPSCAAFQTVCHDGPSWEERARRTGRQPVSGQESWRAPTPISQKDPHSEWASPGDCHADETRRMLG